MAINDEELKDEVIEPKAEEVAETVEPEEKSEVLEEGEATNAEEIEEIVVEENNSKKTTKSKKAGNKKTSKIKATFSELKKVTWPSFGSVVKKTAVVLSVTLIFLLVIIGIDQLLYLLYDLLTSKIA